MSCIALASDHAGYALKAMLAGELRAAGHDVLDLGPDSEASVDYPDFGRVLGEAVAAGRAAYERDTVLFPNSFMPLAVARESSVKLIDEAIGRKPKGHDFDYTRQKVAGQMSRHMSHTGG